MTIRHGLLLAMTSLILLAVSGWAAEPAARPAILLLGQDTVIADWALPQELGKDHGMAVGACGFHELTWEKLRQFNAVVVFDMSRLYEGTRDVNAVEISPEGFQRVSDLLYRYVREGGGLYVYGVSFTHMGQGWANDSLNKFLRPFGAQVLFEVLRDEPLERRQPDGQRVLYALAGSITPHPATSGVRNYWYAVGPFSYGPWTRPLALNSEWTALVRTSAGFKSVPAEDKSWPGPATPTASAVKEKTAVIYAVRQYGQGRIVLNGGESTISFFGYGYSPYADRMWGRIGMEAGLNGIKSDGLQLFAASLAWLAQPSAGKMGGYVPPFKKPFRPNVAAPIPWDRPGGVGGDLPYRKGVLGAQPALGGGSGSIAQWAATAKERQLGFVVFAGDFAKMDRAAWDRMCAECRAATTPDFLAMPGLITRDDQNNSFLQCGPQSWPKQERLSKMDAKHVQDHLGYWMNDSNFPCRAVMLFSQGQYPTWLHSGYDAFAVRTYQDGKLLDEALEGFLQNQEQGDRSRLVVVNLLSSPEKLAEVKEHTYVMAGTAAQLEETFTRPQFSGGAISYVSRGPRIHNWYVSNGTRNTFGEFYVHGTERWRASLRVASEVPLRSVTFYDSTRVFRRLALSGKTADINLDGLHDLRHVLTAVVEDEQGNTAMTGSLDIQDALMVQYFCSDRCNIMSGQSTIRQADGRERIVPASSMLYKAGRLYVGTVALAEELPGIDGSGGGTELSLSPNLYVEATDPAKTENRIPLHRIERPWEASDGLVFDTPILKRHVTSAWVEVFGHAPYVGLAEPRVAARLVQWHFYRKPVYPAPVMAEISTTITDPAGLTLKQGWNGFSQQWTGSWSGRVFKYMVLRADGTHEQGPPADEKVTSWRGTLQPGDCLVFPEVSEGMYVLDGRVDAVVESTPSKKWFRLYLGRFDTPTLPRGATTAARVLNLKFRGSPADDPIADFTRFRNQYGIGGRAPTYTVVSTQGKVTAQRYLLELAADQGAWAGTLGKADLPQRLPVRVAGINDKWTAAKVDLARNEWYPLGVWQGAAYTTLDASAGDQDLFIGNPVVADNADVWLTLLPNNADGKTYVEVHNPTATDSSVTIRVPVATFLAGKQEVKVRVPRMDSARVELRP
jgi:hypothetical protein